MSVNRAGEFRQQLARRVLVADGAIAAVLPSSVLNGIRYSNPRELSHSPPSIRDVLDPG